MPDNNRMLVSICMVAMACAHVLMKILAFSLLLRLNEIILLVYLAGDMFMFFLYKIVRKDFPYHLRVSGLIGGFLSFFARLMTKTIVDFTLIVHFRHDYEMGGLYWTFNCILNQVLCFFAVFLYSKFGEVEKSNMSMSSLWTLVITLFLISSLCLYIFFKFINQDYLKTFSSTTTGSEFLCDTWSNGTSDKERFYVFTKRESYFKSIEKELKEWLCENWDRWEDERDDFFSAKMINKIPSRLLPEHALKKLGGEKNRQKSINAMILAEDKEKKRVAKIEKLNRERAEDEEKKRLQAKAEGQRQDDGHEEKQVVVVGG